MKFPLVIRVQLIPSEDAVENWHKIYQLIAGKGAGIEPDIAEASIMEETS